MLVAVVVGGVSGGSLLVVVREVVLASGLLVSAGGLGGVVWRVVSVVVGSLELRGAAGGAGFGAGWRSTGNRVSTVPEIAGSLSPDSSGVGAPLGRTTSNSVATAAATVTPPSARGRDPDDCGGGGSDSGCGGESRARSISAAVKASGCRST
ncbi:hypothetical protein JD82_00080 [Prauserella rugosa]|uniref:Uncharacterized protein n=1 Tax=Prauserella rugosa TaxID=43354 RepID=A0A660C785_9PSEU|nr:hypothetical protein JD82_00080 [Prauserella rugosa]